MSSFSFDTSYDSDTGLRHYLSVNGFDVGWVGGGSTVKAVRYAKDGKERLLGEFTTLTSAKRALLNAFGLNKEATR